MLRMLPTVSMAAMLQCSAPAAVTPAGPPAAVFDFDFTGDEVPAGITPVRSPASLIYAADGLGVVRTWPTADVAEDHGDGLGRGRCSWPAFSGPDDPTDFLDDWTATALTVTPGAAAGPDGTAGGATRITDASAGTAGRLLYAGDVAAGVGLISQLWHKDDPSDVPTSDPVGAMGSYLGSYAAPVARSVGWHRSVSDIVVGFNPGYQRIIDLRMAGAYPSGGAIGVIDGEQAGITEAAGATGSILAGLHQVQRFKSAVLPVSVGATGALSYEIGAEALADLHDEDGAFQLELYLLTDKYKRQQGNFDGSQDWLLSFETPTGINGIHWTSGALAIEYNGAGDSSVNLAPLRGQNIRILWYANASARGFLVETQGCRAPGGGNVGVALTVPTAGYVLSKAGALQAISRVAYLRKSTRDINAADGVVLGDSLWSNFSGDIQAVGTRIFTPAEAFASNGIVSLAEPGNVYYTSNPAISQSTKWANCTQRGHASVKWILAAVSRNDVFNGRTYLEIKADLDALNTDFAAQNPTALRIWAPMVPSGATLDAGQQAIVDQLNTLILADGLAGGHTHLPLWTGTYRLGEDDTCAGDDPLDNADFGIVGESPVVHADDRGHAVQGASARAVIGANNLLPVVP